MKLVQRTSNTLTMRYVPWGMWLTTSILMAPFLLGACFSERVDLICTRNVQQPTKGQCQLTQSDPRGTEKHRWDLDQITAAKLITTLNSKNRAVDQIVLITKQEQVALFLSPLYGGDMQQQVAKIQGFLANPTQTRLTVQQDAQPIKILALILAIAIEGLVIGWLAGGVTTLRLNKLTGKLTLQHYTLSGTKIVEYPLEKVVDVVVIRSKHHRVAIVLSHSRTEKPVPPNTSLLSILMQVKGNLLYVHPLFGLSTRWLVCDYCAQQIRDFLELPIKSESER